MQAMLSRMDTAIMNKLKTVVGFRPYLQQKSLFIYAQIAKKYSDLQSETKHLNIISYTK